jgi:PAT family acetyl-CoA transporter-like MFS transporter 1
MKRRSAMEVVTEDEEELLGSSFADPLKRTSNFYVDFVLLCALYCFQGIPLGLAGGSIPFLLKAGGASYSSIGLFGLSMLPFALKLGWAPLVDGTWISNVGRRKSWIIPCQVGKEKKKKKKLCSGRKKKVFSGTLMLISSYWIESWVRNGSLLLALVFFVLVLAFATQDIAVDGWALELMADNLPYASTAQSVGQNIGFFCGFTVFLGANSLGLISLGQFVSLWGALFVVCSGVLWWLVPEAPPSPTLRVDSVRNVYSQLIQISRLPDVRRFVLFLLTYGVGFTAHDKALHLRLIDAGFSKELLASLGLFGLPLSVGFAVLTGRWARNGKPLSGPFLLGNAIKFATAIGGLILLWMTPQKEQGPPSFLMVACMFGLFSLGTLSSSLQFVSLCAFFNEISPKSIGGTYLTMLNTVSNLGKAWAGPLVLAAIDYLGFAFVNISLLAAGAAYLVLLIPYMKRCEEAGAMTWMFDNKV